MASRWDAVNWAIGMANRGTGIDIDGAYGMQCVDLPNAVSQKWFGKALWGNAIDLLNSARGAGYGVEGPGYHPKAGDFFVTRESHPYGHTGMVVQDYNGGGSIQTVEQNLFTGGIAGGGPCRRNTRAIPSWGGGTIVGYFTLPWSDRGSGGSGGSPQPRIFKAIGYSGHSMSANHVKSLMIYCASRNILPSGALSQLYLESYFGDSSVGRNDNNWSGMSGSAGRRPSGVQVATGERRAEGGTYMHYGSVDDFFNDWTYLLSKQNMYNVAGKQDIDGYTLGLFTQGGAAYDYAAVGYSRYIGTMRSVRNGINSSNGGYLDELDNAWKRGELTQYGGGGDIDSQAKTDAMCFLFHIKNDKNWNPGTIYFYNGYINQIQGVHNEEELKYLQDVFRKTTGRELKSYSWDANFAPVYRRVFGVLQPGAEDEDIIKRLNELIKEIKEAL